MFPGRKSTEMLISGWIELKGVSDEGKSTLW